MDAINHKPTEHELDLFLKGLVHWERFALHLPEMKQQYIDAIKRGNHRIEQQKLDVFAKWLKVNPDALWEHVITALEIMDEMTIASDLKEKLSVSSKPQVIAGNVQVSKNVVEKLDDLHDSFVSMAGQVKSEVESAVESGSLSVQCLVSRTREYRAYDIPELQSVTTTCNYFNAIYPHYTFLDCHLIIMIASILSGSIFKCAKKYENSLDTFKQTTQVISLRDALEPYFSNFPSRSSLKVTIVLENSWGKHKLWLVEELIKTIFGLDSHDKCQWFQVRPGSLIVSFLVSKHFALFLIANSVKNLQFLRLVGVIGLTIGNISILNIEERDFTFENCFIQAVVDGNVDAVKFLLQKIQVNVNAQTEQVSSAHTQADSQHFAECMQKLRLLEDSFSHYAKQVESAVERMVLDKPITLHNLLDALKAYMPPNTKPIRTAADFIDFVRPHYSFPNCQLLVTVAAQVSDTLQQHINYYNDKISAFKEVMPLGYLQFESFACYLQRTQPDCKIRVRLKLENLWRTRSMYFVEKLSGIIFSLCYPDELQWFKVTSGSVNVVFLASKHKMMRLIVTSVSKTEFMKLTGVISVQVENVYTFIRVKNARYSIVEAIAQAKALHFTEALDLLQQIDQEPLTIDAWRVDQYKNCYVFPDPDSTALMIACCNDNTRLVKLLLDNNANPDIQNKRKYTALMYGGGNSEIVNMLIDRNVDVNLCNVYNENALHWACILGNACVVKLLLRVKKFDQELLNMKQKKGRTPLYMASLFGHIEVVDQLLLAQADPDVQDNSGGTALYVASQEGHMQIVHKLLQSQADPNIRAFNGAIPLYIASQEAHIQIVDHLLEAKSNPNIQNYDGRTPLFIGSQNGHYKVVASLLKEGANPNIQASDGSTPLSIASQNGHFRVVQILLHAQADPNIKNCDGRTPLHISSQEGHLEIVKQLLKTPSNPNIQDNDGITALLLASLQGYSNIVDLLLQAQADPNLKADNGYTPLGVAILNGHSIIAKKLRKAQADSSGQATNTSSKTQ